MTSSADDRAGWAHLLEPISIQNQAMRLALRRRRSLPDVDPDTGEIVDPQSSEESSVLACSGSR